MHERVLKLIRIERLKQCTRGLLLVDNSTVLYTLENPWLDNEPSASCVPEGLYRCVWQKSHRFGWCYQVKNVLDRSRILFHVGNTRFDTSGCILLGRSFSTLLDEPAVIQSKKAIKEFNSNLAQQNFKLEITNAY